MRKEKHQWGQLEDNNRRGSKVRLIGWVTDKQSEDGKEGSVVKTVRGTKNKLLTAVEKNEKNKLWNEIDCGPVRDGRPMKKLDVVTENIYLIHQIKHTGENTSKYTILLTILHLQRVQRSVIFIIYCTLTIRDKI